jgi:hypothetical protein
MVVSLQGFGVFWSIKQIVMNFAHRLRPIQLSTTLRPIHDCVVDCVKKNGSEAPSKVYPKTVPSSTGCANAKSDFMNHLHSDQQGSRIV